VLAIKEFGGLFLSNFQGIKGLVLNEAEKCIIIVKIVNTS